MRVDIIKYSPVKIRRFPRYSCRGTLSHYESLRPAGRAALEAVRKDETAICASLHGNANWVVAHLCRLRFEFSKNTSNAATYALLQRIESPSQCFARPRLPAETAVVGVAVVI